MAASTLTTTTFANDTDAHFRTWVAAFIAAILAGGWTQTGDTGQINTATVTAPVAINTVAGYAMFSSNDAGGALNNFFVKLEFGSGSSAASAPAVWVTVGWATDGAGNFVSTNFPFSTRTQIKGNAIPAGASISINFASGSGYFCIAATSSLINEDLIVSVERTINTALAFQNQILILGFTSPNANNLALNQVVDRLNAYPAISSGAVFSIPPNANTPVAGVVGLGITFGLAPGATSPSLNVFGVESAALGVYQDTITVPVLGVNHNYKLQRDVLFGNVASTVLLTRWE